MTPVPEYSKSIITLISERRTYQDAFEIYHRGIVENCLKTTPYDLLTHSLQQLTLVCQQLYKSSFWTEELYDKTLSLAFEMDIYTAKKTTHLQAAKLFRQLGDLFDSLEKRLESSSYFNRSANAYQTALKFTAAACAFKKTAKRYELLKMHQQEIFSLKKAAHCYKLEKDWDRRISVLTRATKKCFVYHDFFLAEKFSNKVNRCCTLHCKHWDSAAEFFIETANFFKEAARLEPAAVNFKRAAVCYLKLAPPDSAKANENYAHAADYYMEAAKLYEQASQSEEAVSKKKWQKLICANLKEAEFCSKQTNCFDQLGLELILAKIASFYNELALLYEKNGKLAKAASYWMKAGQICAHEISNRDEEGLSYLTRANETYNRLISTYTPLVEKKSVLRSCPKTEVLSILRFF